MAQAFTAHPANAFITESPGFSLSRAVFPETLSEGTSIQNVTVTFKLDQPLPQGINNIFVIIGNRDEVYQNDLVVSHAIDQAETEDWWSGDTDNGSARWSADPSNIQIGKAYTFQAKIETIKSPELSGTPVYKPFVVVIYSNTQNLQPETSNSLTLTNPVLSANVILSADNEVQWNPQIEVSRFDFHLDPYASEITPYPYHVIVPADTVIDPKTINTKNEGNGVFTAFIKLPAPYEVSDVLTDTIKCQNAQAIRCSAESGTIIAKFYRKDLTDLKKDSQMVFEVTGKLKDGSIFKGSSIVMIK